MSRGLGRFQCDLVAWVRDQPGPHTLENLRWALHERSRSGDLPKSYAFAVDRAVKRLAAPDRAILAIENRRLVSLDEWVTHYPGKTLDRRVRRLRLDLLPVLARWVVGQDGPGPRFTTLENERFAFRGPRALPFLAWVKASNRQHSFGKEWKDIEQHIWPFAQRPGYEDLFCLLVRGRELFTNAPVEGKLSFRYLVRSCIERRLLPALVLDQLASLADQVLPPAEAEFLTLKSYVYQCIQPVPIRHPEMRHEALSALISAKSEYMQTVPGFNPPEPRTDTMMIPEDERWRGAVEKGSPLARLIDASVFQEFHFIRVIR